MIQLVSLAEKLSENNEKEKESIHEFIQEERTAHHRLHDVLHLLRRGQSDFPAGTRTGGRHEHAAGDAGLPETGVGLPLLGITAIALQGGRYIELINSRTYPWFATALLVVLYLCIGPVFAVPRTGAVSFEIGIRPFLQEDSLMVGQAVYTALFFGASYYLSLNPNKLIDRVGKLLTPVLLIVLAVLFIKAFATPLGTILPATGNYIDAPFTQGFQDGYQTMDLLASVAIGTLVVNAVRMRGVTDNRAIAASA